MWRDCRSVAYKMSNQKFTASQREAIWLAHEKKCAYTRENLDVSSFHIDHILPEFLAKEPARLAGILSELGLGKEFDLFGFENLLPCKPGINLQKGEIAFEAAPLQYFLAIAANKKPVIQQNLLQIEKRKNSGRVLILLQQCLDRGDLSPNRVAEILEQYVDQPAEVFKLIESMKFADAQELREIAKAEIEELRNRPIKLGANDHIHAVTLTGPNGEKVDVSTCRQYDDAIKSGYYAYTTLDMKMAVFFEQQGGLLRALERAALPTVSYISAPHVGIVDVNLLPYSLFPQLVEEDQKSVGQSYQDKINNGDLIIRRLTQNSLVIQEQSGMGQQLIEAARADFNGDGIEDILVFEYCYATHGTMGYGGIRILTRYGPTSQFQVLSL